MAFKGILDKNVDDSFKINEKFARSFEARKRREEVQKAKEKAKELEIYEGSDIESSESEDSEAELLTQKADTKFVKILSMIQKSDPKLKDPEFKAFSDSDFETSSEKSNKEEKPVRYKELVTRRILDPNGEPVKNTQVSEQKDLKNEFLNAVQEWEKNEVGEDLFRKRKVKENKEKKKDLSETVEKFAENDKELDQLKAYWAKPQTEDDKFLKTFILKKLWEEPESQLLTYNEIVDVEDEKKTNEAEKFETAYNFRFEEEGFEKLKSN